MILREDTDGKRVQAMLPGPNFAGISIRNFPATKYCVAVWPKIFSKQRNTLKQTRRSGFLNPRIRVRGCKHGSESSDGKDTVLATRGLMITSEQRHNSRQR